MRRKEADRSVPGLHKPRILSHAGPVESLEAFAAYSAALMPDVAEGLIPSEQARIACLAGRNWINTWLVRNSLRRLGQVGATTTTTKARQRYA